MSDHCCMHTCILSYYYQCIHNGYMLFSSTFSNAQTLKYECAYCGYSWNRLPFLPQFLYFFPKQLMITWNKKTREKIYELLAILIRFLFLLMFVLYLCMFNSYALKRKLSIHLSRIAERQELVSLSICLFVRFI